MEEHLAIFILCGLTFMMVIDCWIYIKKTPKEDKNEVEEDLTYYEILFGEDDAIRIGSSTMNLITKNAVKCKTDNITQSILIIFDNVKDFAFAVNVLSNEKIRFRIMFEYF